ncbi:MAG: T9SS type A sorting domain-containing protein, partial [Flavobacteriales bacterium]|nr:T9SS type A sorting domain-containing protein [Flavobacteriales bacterium]
TIIRKCPIDQGDTSWTNAAGNDPVNSQWIVLGNNDWSNIGQHIISPCNLTYGCTDSLACNYDSTAYIDDGSCVFPGQIFQNSTTICDGDSVTVGSSVYNTNGAFSDTLVNSLGCDSIVQTNLTIFSQTSLYDTIFGGIPDTSVGTGSYYSGSQYLELSCYEPSDLISALIFSQDTTLTSFEISDEFGNVLFDVTETVIPGGYRVYFNYHLTPGANYRLGVNGQSNDLFRHNSGVNYPYNFGTLAAVTSSSAGGSYYYFYYDIELRQSPEIYSLCDGESVTIAGNVYDTNGLYTDSLISSLGCDSVVYSNVVVSPHVSFLNNPTICNGETYLINGNIYDSSGVYIDSLQTTNGCDSVVTTTLTVLSISGGSGVNNQTICMGDYIMVGTNTYFASGTYFDTLMSSNGCDSVVTTNLNVLTANYANINGGILDTVNGPGDFSSYNGHLLLDVVATTLVKSATVYAVDTNTITFELRDANGLIFDDITHTVFPGEQNLIFNFMLPVGTDYQLGISTGNSGLYRSNAGNGNSLAYPFNAGTVSITSSNAGDQYYYFFYDIEFMPFSTYNEVNICIGDSVTVGGNVYDTPGQYLDNFTANNSCDSVVFTVLDFYQSPPLFIQTSPDPPEICIGETVFLEGSAGFSYYWWDNGSTGNSLLVVPLEDTWYLLSAKDSNDCVVKEDIWVFVDSCITGINDLSHINEIQLYPNPASEQLTIDFTAKATTLKVYNMLGELLSEKKILEGQYKVDIDVKDWKSAIYSVQLCYKDRVIANKVFNVAR